MLSSITPLGQRTRGMSWSRTVIAFWFGASVAGAVVFGLVGLLGEGLGLTDDGWWLAVAALVLALTFDLVGFKPFGPKRQVDEDWLGRYRDWVVGVGFGAQLGVGFLTFVTTWGTWAMLAVSLRVGIPSAMVVGGSFGLGRSLLLISARKSTSSGALAQSMRRFASSETRARWLAMASYGLVALGGVVVVP